jgi:Tfp pilus assembly protein PilP
MKVRQKRQRDKGAKSSMRYIAAFLLAFSAVFFVSPVHGEDAKKTTEDQGIYYSPDGKLDPFEPFIQPVVKKVEQAKGTEEETRPPTPLEMFGIEQLKLVGITMGQDRQMAMIEDPTGKFYPVAKGTFMGFKKGRVTEIRPTEVIVEEKMEDSLGKTRVNRIVLELFSETDGEGP